MNRREFVALVSSVLGAWPTAARAQQQRIPVIGFINPGSRAEREPFVSAFREGLADAGYAEGQNVTIEYRWAETRYDRLSAFAAEFVRRRVAVIVAIGGYPTVSAAKAATDTIPIVFGLGTGDPAELGLVASLNRPGRNVTGATLVASDLAAKQLQLLREIVPSLVSFALLVNPTNRTIAELTSKQVQEAARTLGLQALILPTSTSDDIDSAFKTLIQKEVRALMTMADALFLDRQEQILASAARHSIATIFGRREFVAAGALMSYGSSLADGYRQVGVYAGRVLKGDRPQDLPVMQPTKFELVINLKTAKALGLTVPPLLIAQADEVVE